MAAGTPRAARPGPAPGRLSPSGGHKPANPRRGLSLVQYRHSYRYMYLYDIGARTCSYRPEDTQQHRHLSLANDPLFCSLLPYRARLQPASAEQRMAFAASKAWIELGACGPDNPAVKASGLCLSRCCLWMVQVVYITQTLEAGDWYLSDTLA